MIRPLSALRMSFGLIAAAMLICAYAVMALPAAAKERAKILDVKSFKTPAGIEVWLVSDKSVPVISMNFSFEGGLAGDPAGKPGVARLVSILLDEGAGNIKSQEFQSKLSDNAIRLGFTAGRDAFYGQLRTLTQHRDLATHLLQLALTQPRFDTDAIERMKNANVAQIRHDRGDPAWLVARSFNGMVFEGHAYGLPGAGHLASMATITRQDLIDYTKAQFARDNLKVALAGDITEAQAAQLVDKAFGALPEKSDNAPIGFILPKYAGKTVLYPLDTPQTQITVGGAGIARADKDWHAAVVMNYILGSGNFDARLMREIREKRGLTYGIYSSLQSMRQSALITAGFATSNDKAKEAVDVLKQEWQLMAEKGASEQEIADAKAYLTGSLLLELTSTGDIASTLNGLQRDGLDAEYINRRNAEITKVTAADVRRVAQRLLKADELTIVMVGRPADIKADILLDRPPGMKEPEKK
ncbi:MAG: M16 family metallopeptidase [Alphaproteobacteria bacterium]